MLLQQLHTLTGCLIIFCFISKLFIHYYLDRAHGRTSGIVYSLLAPLPLILPYKAVVANKYNRLKKICNTLLMISAVNLLLNFLIGLLILFA